MLTLAVIGGERWGFILDKFEFIARKDHRSSTFAFIGGVSRIGKPIFFCVSHCLSIDHCSLFEVLSGWEFSLVSAWMQFVTLTFRFSYVRDAQPAETNWLWVSWQLNMTYLGEFFASCRAQLVRTLHHRIEFWIFWVEVFDSKAVITGWGSCLAGQWSINTFKSMWPRRLNRPVNLTIEVIDDLGWAWNLKALPKFSIIFWIGIFWRICQLNHPLQDPLLKACVLHVDSTERQNWLFL